jgi:hypothetical protein
MADELSARPLRRGNWPGLAFHGEDERHSPWSGSPHAMAAISRRWMRRLYPFPLGNRGPLHPIGRPQ